ncbi:zinc ribbon domain-containing protein [Shigella flexneri]
MLAVPPAYTSQRCACCGHTAKKIACHKVNSDARYVDIANADGNGAQHFSGGARRSCLWRDGAVRPAVEAGPTEMIQATA